MGRILSYWVMHMRFRPSSNLILAILLICAILLSGCSSGNTPVQSATPSSEPTQAGTEASATPYLIEESYDPYIPVIVDTVMTKTESGIRYTPKVSIRGDETVAGLINDDIAALMEQMFTKAGYTEGEPYTLTYEIKSNQRMLLSLLFRLAVKRDTDSAVVVKTATYHCMAGKRLSFDEFFNQKRNWQGRVRDAAEAVAADLNLDIIGQIPVVNGSNEFYIADKTLVLVYQQYEIATFASGIPILPIPMYTIEDVMDSDVYTWLAGE